MSSEDRADEIFEKNEKTLSAVTAIDNSSSSKDAIRAVMEGIGSSLLASTIGNARCDTTVLQAQQITHNIIQLVNGTKEDSGPVQQQQQQQNDEPDGLTVEQRNRLMFKAAGKAVLHEFINRLSQ